MTATNSDKSLQSNSSAVFLLSSHAIQTACEADLSSVSCPLFEAYSFVSVTNDD